MFTAVTHVWDGPFGVPGWARCSTSSCWQVFVDNEAGMSANQADILESAIAQARPVTFEEYKSAVEERITCIENLGFAIAERREIPHAGWTEIAFMYGGLPSGEATDAQLDAANACNEHASLWVQTAYQMSATAEEIAAKFAQFRGAILDCLSARGVTMAPNSTQEDIMRADADAAPPGTDTCAMSTGYLSEA